MLRGIVVATTLLIWSGAGAAPGPDSGTRLLVPGWAQTNVAQNEEPTPPPVDSEDPTAPTTTPPASPEEPGGKPGEEPAPAGAPTPGEPPAPPAATASGAPKVTYGAGMHLRGLFVPTWFLGMFLDASTPLNSVALGGEFVRRKGNFDIVASMNFGFYSPENGNYLGNGKNPAIDTDYIEFRNLNLLAFDVAFIGHHYFLPWLSLVYGAGLGFGIVLGDIMRVSNGPQCTAENVSDINKCYPVGIDLNNRDKWLSDHTCTGPDSPGAPCQYREPDVWPVVPIVHLLLGVNFKINEQFSVRVDGGFHDAFYFGAAGHYFFW
jgi:hypothetical protein